MPVTKAVILARGLGTRMRREDPTVTLNATQLVAASAGIKGMIPTGRPFLDYCISALADAGISDVCLVVGPEHGEIRDYYGAHVATERVRIHFAVQELPLGTADAVLAAESFADGGLFIALNSDNYYPVRALQALRQLDAAGLVAFDCEALVNRGNVSARRVAGFATVEIDADGMLISVVEEPDVASPATTAKRAFVSMNCWCFSSLIFSACRRISPSPRGELELPSAVQYAIDHMGARFRVITSSDPVLDLSTRADIATVTRLLSNVEPRL
jgi:glucose-1-phosphate thymidylyltransferase